MSETPLITENEPLSRHNTYKTGGTARYFTMPRNITDLQNVIVWAGVMNLPHEVIGYGANILVSDEGYDGLIISLREFEKSCVRDGSRLLAGAGVLLNDVVLYACDGGLGGMENLSGIPGTIGGAVKMNAGAYDTEIKDIVTRINTLILDENTGEFAQKLLTNTDALFGYREAKGLLGKIILGVEFTLYEADTAELLVRRKEVLARRSEKQPLNYPSCGSVFKRPVNGYAGTLIEQCGLKGYMIGGAQVSEKHANFIINVGGATSADIYKLMKYVQEMVFRRTGVLLEEEVKYIGVASGG